MPLPMTVMCLMITGILHFLTRSLLLASLCSRTFEVMEPPFRHFDPAYRVLLRIRIPSSADNKKAPLTRGFFEQRMK